MPGEGSYTLREIDQINLVFMKKLDAILDEQNSVRSIAGLTNLYERFEKISKDMRKFTGAILPKSTEALVALNESFLPLLHKVATIEEIDYYFTDWNTVTV